MDKQNAREAWDSYAALCRLASRHPALIHDAEYEAVTSKLRAQFTRAFEGGK
jgi:hypothetical protein